MRKPGSPRLARRQVLGGLGALGAGLAACSGERNGSADPTMAGGACALTPGQTEGPFFVPSTARSDIRAGRVGTALELDLRVVDAVTCAPLSGVVVELWHADAAGVYSAFDIADGNTANVAEENFLRGFQQTDGEGLVRFTTIYPGWYPGRTPHLHLKALRGGVELLTTQLYFPDELTDVVFSAEPYASRGRRDTTNSSDALARSGSGASALFVEPVASGPGLAGEFEIGVRV